MHFYNSNDLFKSTLIILLLNISFARCLMKILNDRFQIPNNKIQMTNDKITKIKCRMIQNAGCRPVKIISLFLEDRIFGRRIVKSPIKLEKEISNIEC